MKITIDGIKLDGNEYKADFLKFLELAYSISRSQRENLEIFMEEGEITNVKVGWLDQALYPNGSAAFWDMLRKFQKD
jgi:hypothetical protein